jgi:MFS family permease
MAPSIFSAISPPIAGLIVSRYGMVPGMRVLYIATTLTILCIALLRTFYLEETLETKVELSGHWNHIKDSVSSFKQALWEMNGRLWAFFLMDCLYSFELPIYDVYISLYVLQILGLSEIEWGLLNGVFLPVSILIGIPAGKLVDRVPRRQSLLISYVFSALVGLFLAYSQGIYWVILAFALRAIGQTIGFPAVHALRADLMPKETRGRLIGLLSVLKKLAVVPSALLFAWIYQNISPQTLFVASFMINILTLLIIFISFNKRDLEK